MSAQEAAEQARQAAMSAIDDVLRAIERYGLSYVLVAILALFAFWLLRRLLKVMQDSNDAALGVAKDQVVAIREDRDRWRTMAESAVGAVDRMADQLEVRNGSARTRRPT